MNELSVKAHIDLYKFWVRAQKSVQNMLSIDNDFARISDKVEISEREVRLKGKESIDALSGFFKALQESAWSVKEGLPQLEDLIRQVEKGEARTQDMAGLEHRLKHMKEFLECCERLEELLKPVISGNLALLLEPRLFGLLQRLESCFGGEKSPPIGVILTLTYDV